MILFIYVLLTAVAAWLTKNPCLLLYGTVPLGFQIYCTCSKIDKIKKQPTPCIDEGPSEVDCKDRLEKQVEEWKAIGGPYYLHSDYQLVHFLYKVRPIDSKAVHLCNLMLRMVEETTITDYPTAEQKSQMQCWYIELINRLGQYTTIGPQIQDIMYRYAAPYLI